MNISQRLRTCAKHTGLDALIELLQEAADEIDALQARAQGHPAQAEVTDGVSLDERFRDWTVTIKDAHDNSLDGEHASSRSMLRGVIYEMEEARAILALHPERVPMIATRPQAMAKPSAWIDNSGHPHHLSYVQGVRERQLYGALQPLYEHDDLAAAVAAERERCAQLCEQWNATPGHKLAREIRGA